MPRKKDNFFHEHQFELLVGVAILFFIILLIFGSRISAWLKGKKDNDLFKIKPVTSSLAVPTLKKNETRCRDIFQNLLGRPFLSSRPEFLRRKSTRACLELDGYNKAVRNNLYNKDMKLAFEYNGSQHYKYNPRFHRSMKDFEDQKVRDIEKVQMCRDNEVILITIPYTVKYEKLESYIRSELNKLGFL